MAKMSGNNQYLIRHNGHPTWHCMKDVPIKLRPIVGKARLVQSLHTHDLTLARSRKWEVLADFERILEAARVRNTPATAVEAGLAWRATRARIEAGDAGTIAAHGGHSETGAWDERGRDQRLELSPQDKARENAQFAFDELVDNIRHYTPGGEREASGHLEKLLPRRGAGLIL